MKWSSDFIMFISVGAHISSSQLAVECRPDITMGGFISKSIKKRRISDQEVLSRLEQQRNDLIMIQQQIEPIIEKDCQRAKQLILEGKRQEAKTVLRRKLYREQQLRSSNAQLDRIDEIANDFKLACSLNELSRTRERKIKRGRWRSIVKRKFKTRQHNSNTRKKPEKNLDDDIEIQEIIVVNNKERKMRQKVYTKARNGIRKQNEIDEAMMRSFKLETGDEEAVHEELEAILNDSYQLPDIDQDNITTEVDSVNVSNRGITLASGA